MASTCGCRTGERQYGPLSGPLDPNPTYTHTYIHTYIHSFNLSSGGEKLAQLQTWAAAHAVSLRFKSKEPDGPKGMSLATLRSR